MESNSRKRLKLSNEAESSESVLEPQDRSNDPDRSMEIHPLESSESVLEPQDRSDDPDRSMEIHPLESSESLLEPQDRLDDPDRSMEIHPLESSESVLEPQDRSDVPDQSMEIHSLVEERSDSMLNINSLPEDVLITIFRYLDLKERCRAGRVCKYWHEVARDEIFWRKITAEIKFQRHSFIPRKAFSLIEIVPSCVTHISINFKFSPRKWSNTFITFTDFSGELRERCPNLEVLFLRQVRFDVCGENLNLCTHMPASTRILAVHNSQFSSCKMLKEIDSDIPKIKILDLSSCEEVFIRPASFLLMSDLEVLRLSGCQIVDYLYFESAFGDLVRPPAVEDLVRRLAVGDLVRRADVPHLVGHPAIRRYRRTRRNSDYYFACVVRVLCHQLKVLDLECTRTNSITFREIYTHCNQLTELYVCATLIRDKDIMLSDQETVLPSLKIVCFRQCRVTGIGIDSFISSCPSLTDVYVGSWIPDPTNNYFDCKSDKVHVLYEPRHCCYHYKKVDYMNK